MSSDETTPDTKVVGYEHTDALIQINGPYRATKYSIYTKQYPEIEGPKFLLHIPGLYGVPSAFYGARKIDEFKRIDYESYEHQS